MTYGAESSADRTRSKHMAAETYIGKNWDGQNAKSGGTTTLNITGIV